MFNLESTGANQDNISFTKIGSYFPSVDFEIINELCCIQHTSRAAPSKCDTGGLHFYAPKYNIKVLGSFPI
jgi:hypothetical protein